MGLLDGKITVNPPLSRMSESELDLVVAGTADAILMVEAGAKGVTEQTVLEALEMAHDAIKGICAAQLELQQQVGWVRRSASTRRQLEHLLGVADWDPLALLSAHLLLELELGGADPL